MVCVPAGLFSPTVPDVVFSLVFAIVVVTSAVGFTTAVCVCVEDEENAEAGQV
jgi:hypothetical protein